MTTSHRQFHLLWVIAAMAMPPRAHAQSHAAAVCYRVLASPWSDTLARAIRLNGVVIRLDSNAAGSRATDTLVRRLSPSPSAIGVRRDLGPGPARVASWEAHADSIILSWPAYMHGVTVRAVRQDSSLVGDAEYWTGAAGAYRYADASMRPTPAASARIATTRIRCD